LKPQLNVLQGVAVLLPPPLLLVNKLPLQQVPVLVEGQQRQMLS
jgi:hypothetical protein